MGKYRPGLGFLKSPEDPPAGEEPASGTFDWGGVVVRHWRVGEALARRDKSGAVLYRCVSRCGVSSPFRRGTLATGATLTCEACRSGAAPDGRVVVAEPDLPTWHRNWEGVAVDEKSNLKGRNALRDWEERGRPAVLAVIDRSGLGRDFGWKCYVRDCHEMNRSGYTPHVRVKSASDGQRRVELSVRPDGGAYTFDVDLATGRTDRPFAEVRALLEAACVPPAPADGQPAAPVPAPAAETPRETILGGLDVGKLLRLRAGFDTLLTVGKEVDTATQLKAEAAAELGRARAAAGPSVARADAAAAVAQRAIGEHQAAHERVQRLAAELQQATAARDRLGAEMQAQIEARDRAFSEYAPLRDAVARAERDLAEAGKLEEERLKALGKADDILPLLAALQRLGAQEAA